MLSRYVEIKHFISQVFGNENLHDMLLTPIQEKNAISLLTKLKIFNSTCIELQANSTNIADVRYLFDLILENFPETVRYLGQKEDKYFENAIIKIQNGKAGELTYNELEAAKPLQLLVAPSDTSSTEDDDFVKNALKKRKLQLSTSCRFMRTEFITPTSNNPERFFSKAGYAYNDYRKSMLPANLEMQLFLHYNHKFWDINTVKECVDKNNF